jgi:hypothetical protein
VYYEFLLWTCSIGLLATVPLIVFAPRARRPRRALRWLVIPLASALGWISANAYVNFPYEYYGILLWVCSISFLAAVPLVLAARAGRPQRMPWWLVVALAAAVGWMASNSYVHLEQWQISAKQAELARRGILADFFVVADPAFTLRWGWALGLMYLIICLGLYPIFRLCADAAASRPFIGLLASAVALAIFSAVPPWRRTDPLEPFGFVVLFAFFLTCAGLSHQLLRIFRATVSWVPFVAMFIVSLSLGLALRYAERPDLPLQIRPATEWAALLGALFTAFWWIAIRKRSPTAGYPR